VVLRLVLEENSQVLSLPGTLVRVEEVEGRRDITLAAIQFLESAVPHAFKLKMNEAIRSMKDPGAPSTHHPQG
jgi:hypothetical protein